MRIERIIFLVIGITGIVLFSGCAASTEVSRDGAAVTVGAGVGTEAVRPSTVVAAQSVAAVPTQLAVIWSSADPDVAHNVCLMYTHAAKQAKWFEDVTLIVWGPSSKLLSEDKKLQDKIGEMINSGVTIQACVVCADRYGVTEDLRGMGIEVKPMGKPLSEMLKTGWKVLVF